MKFFTSIASALAMATAASAAAVDIEARAATPTLTDTFAPVPTGCAGLTDRQIFSVHHKGIKQYQIFCFSQPGGYASIPGASYAARSAVECAGECNKYNELTSRPYTCHAGLYTLGNKQCQLLWQANGNISPRSDSHYVVAHNF